METKDIIPCIKHIGQTPLEVIEILREEKKWPKDKVKLSYAGRLDPMAHGLMIVLKDKECYNQHIWHNMPKTYEFKLLVGISTDTYDILGLIKSTNLSSKENTILAIEKIKSHDRTFFQEYPPYSSVRVDGKPLWKHAKENNLENIKIPGKKVTIKQIGLESVVSISKKNLLTYVNHKIGRMNNKHNFRQKEILESWQYIPEQDYNVISVKANVSCGFYVRSFCHNIGEKIGVPCLALDIMRSQVGDYYFL